MAFVDRVYPLKKLFMVNHNPGNLRRKARVSVIKHLFSRRWSYVGVSGWVCQDFLEHAPFLSPEHINVLYNCLDIDAVIGNQLERKQARRNMVKRF